MATRDDFSEKTRQAVAARAGWHCSLAGCAKLTVGPSEEKPDAVTRIGVAAHICAAAPGGRRYDASMTSEERSSIANAIWLCADHATLIDRDEVTYTTDDLQRMKLDHEAACARAVRLGLSAEFETCVFAIGPEIICTGTFTQIDAASWSLRLHHFLTGDLPKLASFIGGFAAMPKGGQYILSAELGEGRVLLAAPSLRRQPGGNELICPVASAFPRTSVHQLGSGLASHPDTNDLFLDMKGNIARVSGLDYFPQRVREVLSMQRGESPMHPHFGVRLFEYFETYGGTPWLDLMFKLEVVRQTCIPFEDKVLHRFYTPLQCVTRVRSVELLAGAPVANRLPIRLVLEVEGLGEWQEEVSIYMPTPEQMEKRAQVLATIHQAFGQS